MAKNIGRTSSEVQGTKAYTYANIVDQQIINSALVKDSDVSSNKKDYITNNYNLYEIAIVSWLGLLHDISRRKQPEIASYIGKLGLILVIKEASLLSDMIVKDQSLPNSPFSYFIMDVTNCNEVESKRLVLSGLRYLKRLSPYNTEVLTESGFKGLYNSNNHCKMWSRRNSSYYTLALRKVIRSFFNLSTKYCSRLDEALILPTGAVFNSRTKTLSSKLLELEKFYPGILGTIYGSYSGPTLVRNYTTRVVAVPKSYKAVRIIAIEEVVAQIEQQDFVLNFLRMLTSKTYPISNMDITDQYRNRELARLGSIDGSLSTIDLSSASDTVSHSLIMEVLPPVLALQYDKVRSTHFQILEKKSLSSIASTMGSRITFPLETMIFYGIAILSVELYSSLCRIPKIERNALIKKCSAFGDDIIVPTESAGLCLQLLEHFGFFPNTDKSFFNLDLHYRESCGEEYLDGVNISSKYFPRRLLPTDNVELLTFLIALQHKLVDYREVNTYLIDKIRRIRPQMTESYVGSIYSDIWSYYPLLSTVRLSGWIINHDQLMKIQSESEACIREKHYMPISKYTCNSNKDSEDAYMRYAYYEFLLHGPYYASELDSLLNVSSRRIVRDAFIGESRMDHGYIID